MACLLSIAEVFSESELSRLSQGFFQGKTTCMHVSCVCLHDIRFEASFMIRRNLRTSDHPCKEQSNVQSRVAVGLCASRIFTSYSPYGSQNSFQGRLSRTSRPLDGPCDQVNVIPLGNRSSDLPDPYSILHGVPSRLARDWFPGSHRGLNLSLTEPDHNPLAKRRRWIDLKIITSPQSMCVTWSLLFDRGTVHGFPTHHSPATDHHHAATADHCHGEDHCATPIDCNGSNQHPRRYHGHPRHQHSHPCYQHSHRSHDCPPSHSCTVSDVSPTS